MKNRILLIENNEVKYKLLFKYLEALRHPGDQVTRCKTINEAVAVSPDDVGLIMLHISVNETNDAAGIRCVKRFFIDVPVIVLLDTDDTGLQVKAIREGAQEILAYNDLDTGKLDKAIMFAKERKAKLTRMRGVLEDYQRHFENGPIPMWIVDIKTMKFLVVNNAAVEKYGYSKEEFSNLSLVDIRPKEDVGRMLETFNRRADIYFDAGYWRHIKKNGEIFYVHVYSHAINYEKTPARLSFIVDVNEKVLADKQNKELNALIKEQKEQLDSILFSINDAIWSRRADTYELIYANNAYYKLYDYTPENMKTDNDFILNSVYADDREIFRGAMHEVMEKGETEIIYRYHHQNGSLRTLKASAKYKKGVNGKPDTINGITIDISKEKELYDVIRNSEHKLLSTINNTKDLIWTVDTELRIIFCNKPYQDYFYKIAGVILDEGDYVLGKWNSEAFTRRRKKEYQRALNGESFTTVIEESRDGQVQYHEISSNPVLGHHGNIIGVNCILRDITEPRMQLLRIQQQNEKLKEIAWIQSHKVRGPVASILGLISLVNPEQETPHNVEIIEMLRNATNELDGIIREVVTKTNDIDYSYTFLPSVKTNE